MTQAIVFIGYHGQPHLFYITFSSSSSIFQRYSGTLSFSCFSSPAALFNFVIFIFFHAAACFVRTISIPDDMVSSMFNHAVGNFILKPRKISFCEVRNFPSQKNHFIDTSFRLVFFHVRCFDVRSVLIWEFVIDPREVLLGNQEMRRR